MKGRKEESSSRPIAGVENFSLCERKAREKENGDGDGDDGDGDEIHANKYEDT